MAEEEQSVLKLLIELVDQVTEPLRSIHENFEEFESGIWDVSRAFASAFVGWEMFEHLAEPASEFQEAQTRLALATHASAEELQRFKEQAEELSQTYPSNIEDVTQAQTLLYQTFRDQKTVLEATENADKLATAMRWSASDAANILASAYENLAPKGADVSETMKSFADKLTLLNTQFPATTASASIMARDFSRLGASAKTYGIGINQIFALLGELNRLHVGGSRGAGMYAQMLIRSLAEVDKNGVPALARYGLVVEKDRQGNMHLLATLQHLAKMSPQALKALEQHLPEQGQMISQLVSHIDELQDAYKQFDAAAGSTDDAVRTQNETFQNAEARFKNSITNLKELVGILALPTLTKTTDNLVKLVTLIEKFADAHPKIAGLVSQLALFGTAAITVVGALGFVGKAMEFVLGTGARFSGLTALWGMLTTAIEGVQLALGGAATAGEALTFVFESNPIGWILTIVAALAFASYEVWKHWDAIAAAIERVWNVLKTMPEGIWDVLTGTVNPALVAKVATGLGAPSFQTVTPDAITANQANNHIHFESHVTVNAAPGQSPQEIAHAVGNQIDLNLDDLREHAERGRRENRLSFRDSTNPLFAR